MALFCDSNFQHFGGLYIPEVVFQRIKLPVFNLWISRMLPYVDWVLASIAFLMRPKSLIQTIISDCNHKDNMPPFPPLTAKGITEFLIPYQGRKELDIGNKVRSSLKPNTETRPLQSTKTKKGPPFHVQLSQDSSILSPMLFKVSLIFHIPIYRHHHLPTQTMSYALFHKYSLYLEPSW